MTRLELANFNLLCQAIEQGKVTTHLRSYTEVGRIGRPTGHSESPITRAKRRVNSGFASGRGYDGNQN